MAGPPRAGRARDQEAADRRAARLARRRDRIDEDCSDVDRERPNRRHRGVEHAENESKTERPEGRRADRRPDRAGHRVPVGGRERVEHVSNADKPDASSHTASEATIHSPVRPSHAAALPSRCGRDTSGRERPCGSTVSLDRCRRRPLGRAKRQRSAEQHRCDHDADHHARTEPAQPSHRAPGVPLGPAGVGVEIGLERLDAATGERRP